MMIHHIEFRLELDDDRFKTDQVCVRQTRRALIHWEANCRHRYAMVEAPYPMKMLYRARAIAE